MSEGDGLVPLYTPLAFRPKSPSGIPTQAGPVDSDLVRQFDTGAIRDLDATKHDFEGFLSHYVLRRYAAYMHEHRQTAAGLRDSDNWQKGIPRDAYMKSMWRHFMDVWEIHRTQAPIRQDGRLVDLDEALCSVLFNVMGLLHEVLKEE